MIIELQDGRTVSVPLQWYPRLAHGSPSERRQWELIGPGIGIHWPALDEDLSVDGPKIEDPPEVEVLGQNNGMLMVQALGCDAYVASSHKWMMAPKGTGILYIRRDLQDRFWTTPASYQWENHVDGAFRFMQYGTGSVPVVDGLLAALRFIEKVGLPRIERWDGMLTKRLRDGFAKIPAVRLASPADQRLASAITTFRVDGVKAKALQDALWARKVRVRAQNDERGIRLSAHMYVGPADIDTILDVTRQLAAQHG